MAQLQSDFKVTGQLNQIGLQRRKSAGKKLRTPRNVSYAQQTK